MTGWRLLLRILRARMERTPEHWPLTVFFKGKINQDCGGCAKHVQIETSLLMPRNCPRRESGRRNWHSEFRKRGLEPSLLKGQRPASPRTVNRHLGPHPQGYSERARSVPSTGREIPRLLPDRSKLEFRTRSQTILAQRCTVHSKTEGNPLFHACFYFFARTRLLSDI